MTRFLRLRRRRLLKPRRLKKRLRHLLRFNRLLQRRLPPLLLRRQLPLKEVE
jgi:hypothetical protein